MTYIELYIFRLYLSHLWMQFLLSRYAMPAAASTEKRTSCFVFSSSFFFLRKDRKSPPDETQEEEEFSRVRGEYSTLVSAPISNIGIGIDTLKLVSVPILETGIGTDTGIDTCTFVHV